MANSQSKQPCDPAGDPLPEFTDAASHTHLIRDGARETAIKFDKEQVTEESASEITQFSRTDKHGLKGFGAYTPHYPRDVMMDADDGSMDIVRSGIPARYVGGVRFKGHEGVEAVYRVMRFTPTSVQDGLRSKTMLTWSAWDIVWSTAPKSPTSLVFHFDSVINNTKAADKIDQTNEWPDPGERPRLVHTDLCDIHEIEHVISKLLGVYPIVEERFDAA